MNHNRSMALFVLSSLALSGSASANYGPSSGGYQPSQYQAPQYQNAPPQQQPQPQYQNSYGPPPAYYPTYPAYPIGGYLAPGPVDPGEDAANRIYEENQHPPR